MHKLGCRENLVYPSACPKISIHFRGAGAGAGAAGAKETSPRFVHKRP